METTLHRQLKSLYALPGGQTEKTVGRYRIDVAEAGRLIEIQHSSLSGIRQKVAHLVAEHHVLVVKPLIQRKRIVRLSRKGGQVVSRRWSPKQGSFADVLDELMYFREVFPHSNLRIDVPLVDIEEWRYQGQGRRQRSRKDDYQLQDQLLLSVNETLTIASPTDLWQLVDMPQKTNFTTLDLTRVWNVPRWQAQKIAYTLQHCQAIKRVGKQGNSFVYSVCKSKTASRKKAG
jgi:hypothetical protein